MSTLETLKRDWERKKWEEIAEDVVKYQNFKASVAWSKIRSDKSKTTRINYLNAGRNYILTGKPRPIENVGPGLFTAIDEVLKRHVQPLTPKAEEQARPRGKRKVDYTKKDARLPIQIPEKITAEFEYGVKIGKTIYLQENERDAKMFLEGAKAAGGNAILVSVEFGKI